MAPGGLSCHRRETLGSGSLSCPDLHGESHYCLSCYSEAHYRRSLLKAIICKLSSWRGVWVFNLFVKKDPLPLPPAQKEDKSFPELYSGQFFSGRHLVKRFRKRYPQRISHQSFIWGNSPPPPFLNLIIIIIIIYIMKIFANHPGDPDFQDWIWRGFWGA
eukprot:jgi/Botrbrau1/8748/Bobra.0090s0022.1